MISVYEEIVNIRNNGISAALCIVTSAKGSTPRKEGAKMIVKEDGSILGTIGGGNLEKEVIKNALEQIKKKEAKKFVHDLLHEHNMCCGGSMEIYIEPVMKKNKLFIFGAGHTGEALARLMINTEFEIYVIDDRKDYLDSLNIEGINKIHADFDKIVTSLPFDDHTYVVIMTYSHPVDRSILVHCLKQERAYLGMIGSKRKVEMTKKMFISGKMASLKELSIVDMPMGFDIGADGPYEIAVSIGARLISVKNKVKG